MWSTIIEGEGPGQSLTPFRSQWWNLAKEEEGWGGGGGSVYLVSTGKLPPLKTAKKSGWIRKWSVIWGRWMSPRGNTPPFHSPCIADDNQCALASLFSLRTHTALRSGAEGGVAEKGGEVDRRRERVFMPQCVTNKREEKIAEGAHNKAPWLAGAPKLEGDVRCGAGWQHDRGSTLHPLRLDTESFAPRRQ